MATICFDLDGTLVDPMEGIQLSLGSLCDGLKIPCPGREEIARHLGLDLEMLFKALPGLREPHLREAAMAGFWKHFGEEGLYAQRVLAGTHLMLARLKRQGHRLYLITGHSATVARRTLHHFDLNLLFNDVIGPPLQEGWKPKGVVMEVLARDGILGSGGYMIGDRADDMQGGKSHGLKAIGVSYGYGTREELLEAGADLILDSVDSLDAWLQIHLTEPEIHDPFSRSE